MVSNVSFRRLADDAPTACYQTAPAQQCLFELTLMRGCLLTPEVSHAV